MNWMTLFRFGSCNRSIFRRMFHISGIVRLLWLKFWWDEGGIGTSGRPVQQMEQVRYCF
jgi:hypothetical protein